MLLLVFNVHLLYLAASQLNQNDLCISNSGDGNLKKVDGTYKYNKTISMTGSNKGLVWYSMEHDQYLYPYDGNTPITWYIGSNYSSASYKRNSGSSVGLVDGGDVFYGILNDNSGTWQYYNGSAWVDDSDFLLQEGECPDYGDLCISGSGQSFGLEQNFDGTYTFDSTITNPNGLVWHNAAHGKYLYPFNESTSVSWYIGDTISSKLSISQRCINAAPSYDTFTRFHVDLVTTYVCSHRW